MFGKIKKYVIGFFVLLGGFLIAFFSGKDAGRSKERRKDVDKKLDIVKNALKSNKKYKKSVKDILKAKKKELEQLKKEKKKGYVEKKVNVNKAANFLKKYANKKK